MNESMCPCNGLMCLFRIIGVNKACGNQTLKTLAELKCGPSVALMVGPPRGATAADSARAKA